jgi:DNA-binding transcriptional regulator YhcF (GntR family)
VYIMPRTSNSIQLASPRPRYLQLADDLRRQIEDGTLSPGDQVSPEVELAQRHNLARGTVRQALQLLVNQGLLERSRRKGTFVANKGPAVTTTLIGIIVPYMQDALIHGILHGVESTLRLNGYSLIFGQSDGDLDVEVEQVRRLHRERASGLILWPAAQSSEAGYLESNLPPRFPVVLIDRTVPGLRASRVLVDNYGGAYRAVEHLVALGHERIGCITHAGEISCVDDRIRGWQPCRPWCWTTASQGRMANRPTISPRILPRSTGWFSRRRPSPRFSASMTTLRLASCAISSRAACAFPIKLPWWASTMFPSRLLCRCR